MTEENAFERAGLEARGFRFWMDKRGNGNPPE